MDERINHGTPTVLFDPNAQSLPKAHAHSRLHALLALLSARKGFFFLAALLLLGAVAFSTLYYPTYVVSVDGIEIGKVAQREAFEAAVAQAEDAVSQVLGKPYHLAADPSYQYLYTYGNEYTSSSAMEQQLLGTVDEIEQLYALRVDGALVGAAKDMDSLVALLHQVMAPYQGEQTRSVYFAEPVSIREEYVAKTTEQDPTNILQALQTESGTDQVHHIQAGDALSSIAAQWNVAVEQILNLNPGLTNENLSSYQTLAITEKAPLLSVYVEKTATYAEEIPFETRTVNDASLYKGERAVKTAGSKGEKQIVEEQILKNNRILSRTVTEETVTQAPVAEVVSVGTKERPKTAATGSFVWPTSGNITSKFGYRRIFGSTSFHSGIDIANKSGTAIKAADGGTVTFTGYKGTYGNLVIIDHGNGKQTYYAHCSQILVSKGAKVAKGQLIARMGATGRATGSHLHFEIRVGGKAVNPLSYL
jgi:murein DD-endopeptidase MepM/ murein hydrolase activator NlpD